MLQTTSMPEVIIELAEGRSVDQKRSLVKDITDAVVRNCNVSPDAVTVIIHENPRTDKAKGGVLFSERSYSRYRSRVPRKRVSSGSQALMTSSAGCPSSMALRT